MQTEAQSLQGPLSVFAPLQRLERMLLKVSTLELLTEQTDKPATHRLIKCLVGGCLQFPDLLTKVLNLLSYQGISVTCLISGRGSFIISGLSFY